VTLQYCEFEAALSTMILRAGRTVALEAWSASTRLLYLTAAICIALTALPCGAQEAPRTSPFHDLQSIVDAKVLRVALTRFDLPGFHTHGSDGSVRGAEIDLAEQIGRALGVKVDLIENAESFDAVIDLVATDRADIGISRHGPTSNRVISISGVSPIRLRTEVIHHHMHDAQPADPLD
jgi:ABC-type amino acid transport substrate-binding protein